MLQHVLAGAVREDWLQKLIKKCKRHDLLSKVSVRASFLKRFFSFNAHYFTEPVGSVADSTDVLKLTT